MKRIYVALILLLCALMAFGAQAAEVAPGETVTVPISIGASQAQQIKLYITFDTNALEYVAISSGSF